MLRYATEIADALDKAHRQGIVHRDLKPGNIMLTSAGTKLLDFGLAKLKAPTEGAAGLTALPTQSAGLTVQGTILGTLQYMAPEQLDGKEADARSDLFAFGAILYEMVTGKKAFEGEGQASLIHAIMGVDPPAMSTLQSMTPPALDHVVTTCLAKKPDERWQSAGDVGRQLTWITEGGSQPSVAASATAVPQRAGWRQAVPLAAVSAAVAALIVGVAVWNLTRPSPAQPRPLAQFVLLTPTDGPVRRAGNLSKVAISPDGTSVVYTSGEGGASSRRLYLRQIGELDATPLRGTEGARSPSFSPDGQWVGFMTPSGDPTGNDISLKRVSVIGGPAVTIVETDTLIGTSWGPDEIIVFGGPSGLMRVPAVGGEPEPLTTVDPDQGEIDHRWPEVLPNGKGVLFTAWSGTDEGSRLAVVSLETGAVSYLLPGGSFPRYAPTGHIVYGVGGTLRAVGFDADSLELTSTNPTPVMENVATTLLGAASFGIAENGSLVYVMGARTGESAQRALVWVDRAGREEPLASPLLAYQRPRVSRGGTRVAVDVDGPEGADIWIHDLARGTETRFTTDPGIDNAPLWTPDGERVVFASNRDGQTDLFWKLTDTPGDAERIMTGGDGLTTVEASAWSDDGQTLLFWDAGNRVPDIGVLSMEDERTSERLFATTFTEAAPAISPDGRWIAYLTDETGQDEVYVQRFPELGSRQTISTDGGQQPLWSPDGRELFYRNGDEMMVVPVETDPTFRAGDPEVLFEQQYYLYRARRTYDLAPDGQRFLMVKEGATSDAATQIILVQNWFEELRRLVPID